MALPRKKFDFELETCVNERGGRAACCMGSVPVVQVLASVARQSPPTLGAHEVADDPSNSLFRAINRESHAGLSNSLKLHNATYTAVLRAIGNEVVGVGGMQNKHLENYAAKSSEKAPEIVKRKCNAPPGAHPHRVRK